MRSILFRMPKFAHTYKLAFYVIAMLISPSILFINSLHAQVEICENGIDDDGDGLIDMNDPECACEVIEIISLIPNPSFEEQSCCPDNRSQLYCATSWIQASEPTTDFIHTCDWLGWDDFPPPQPFPDGEGIMGFRDGRVRGNNNEAEPYWKEYAGACLLSPLLTDTTYRFQFDVGFVSSQKSPPINITFFGTESCDFLPFGSGNEAFGCPSNSPEWIKLGEVFVSGTNGNKWVNTSLEITPDRDIAAIAIGPACNPVSSPISIYYFFDNLLLADFNSFDLQISEIEHPCSNDFVLKIPSNPDFEYQWFKDGVALLGETSAEMSKIYGEGNYSVRIKDGVSCRVSSGFNYEIPEFNTSPLVTICNEDAYPFGDLLLTEPGTYLDTFKNVNNCDSIVALELKVLGAIYDTVAYDILNGESIRIDDFEFSSEGEYPLTLISEQGCDSLVLLKLSLFDIYFPNIFSPNQDGQNDTFFPLSSNENILAIELSIYDRWGNLLHLGSQWDGRSNGASLNPGVFIYKANIQMKYDIAKTFYGSITLVK